MLNKIIFSFLFLILSGSGFAQSDAGLQSSNSSSNDSLALFDKIAHLDFDKKEDFKIVYDLYKKGLLLPAPLIRKILKRVDEGEFYSEGFRTTQNHVRLYIYNPKYQNLDSALYFNKIRLEYARKTKDVIFEVSALADMSSIYSSKDSVALSMKHDILAYDLLSSENHPATIQAIGNLAIRYYDVGDVETAKSYLQKMKALESSSNMPNLEFYNATVNNLYAKIYESEGKLDSAVFYGERAFDYITQLDTMPHKQERGYDRSAISRDLALVYMKLKNLDKAEYYLGESRKSLEDTTFRSYTFLELQLLKNNLSEAKKYLFKDEIKNSTILNRKELSHLQATAKYYNLVKDYKQEAEIYRKLYNNQNFAFNENRKYYMSIADFQINEARQEQEISRLALEQEQSDFELTVSQILAGTLLVLFIMFSILYKQVRDKNYFLNKDLKSVMIISEQAEKLKELDLLKSNYFNNISHEFKTSLTLINAPLQRLVKKYKEDTDALPLLTIINDNSRFLGKMTDDILDLAKGDVNDTDLTINQFKLSDFVDYLVSSFVVLSQQKNIQFQAPFHVSDVSLITDAEKLITIVRNLLSNAFKYTNPQGAVVFNIIDLGDQIQIVVKDNGIGISEVDLPNIFERYYQIKQQTDRNAQGVGIGLSICEQYVKAIEGNIEVTSSNEGSIFIMTIPKKISQTDQQVLKSYVFKEKSTFNSSDSSSVIVKNESAIGSLLIVEDNQGLRDYLQLTLSSDYDLVFATNGSEALDVLNSFSPDLIITDLMMPVMDGLELLKRVRSDEKYRNTPILMLTAKNNNREDISNYFSLGLDDYLMKPFTDDVLSAHITNLLDFTEDRKVLLSRGESTAETQNVKELTRISSIEIEEKEEENPSLPKLSKFDQQWLDDFKNFVEVSVPNYNLNLDMVADDMALSVSQLNRKVNAFLGMTPKRYIKEVRLLKARTLLESGDYNSVKSVAFAVGYNSNKVFSRNFKARFGKYPSEYIEKTSYS